MSAAKAFLVLFVILYSVNKAFCLKCYHCSSDEDEKCRTEPQQKKFEEECLEIKLPGIPRVAADQCLKTEGTSKGKSAVSRMCSMKSWTDDEIKELVEIKNDKVEKIYRCDTDLCNSSNNLTIGLSVTISSFLLYLLTKP